MTHQKPYYGPAGIFSTDNPQSDRMQIEAEQGEEEQDERDLAGVTCGGCGHDMYECTCPPDYETEKYFAVVAHCESNTEWHDYNLSVPESEVEMVKHTFTQQHAEQCKCGKEPKISVEEV